MGICSSSMPHEAASATVTKSYAEGEVVLHPHPAGTIELGAEVCTGEQVVMMRVCRKHMRSYCGHALLRQQQLVPTSFLHYTFLVPSKLVLTPDHLCLSAPNLGATPLLHHLHQTPLEEPLAVFICHQLISAAQHLHSTQGDAEDLQLGLLFLQQGEGGSVNGAPLARVFHPGRPKRMTPNDVVKASRSALQLRGSNDVTAVLQTAIEDAQELPYVPGADRRLCQQVGALLAAMVHPHLPTPLVNRAHVTGDPGVQALLQKRAMKVGQESPLSSECLHFLSYLLPPDPASPTVPPTPSLYDLHHHPWLQTPLPETLSSALEALHCQQKVNDLRAASPESFFVRQEPAEQLLKLVEAVARGGLNKEPAGGTRGIEGNKVRRGGRESQEPSEDGSVRGGKADWMEAELGVTGLSRFSKASALSRPSFSICSIPESGDVDQMVLDMGMVEE